MTKILFITLSNIGDCILTLPALDILLEEYPDAEFSVICSARSQEVFSNNPFLKEILIYDKKAGLAEKVDFIRRLRKNRYDLVADLRNTILPYVLGTKRIGGLFTLLSRDTLHMRDRHLRKISAEGGFASGGQNAKSKHFFQSSGNKHKEYGDYIVVAPGARSHLKRWKSDGFAQACDSIIEETGLNIVLAGNSEDKTVTGEIISRMHNPAVNLAGKTTFSELADLIRCAKLVISSDSASLHLASYLNKPVVAIFGPSNEKKYGPWSQDYSIVKKEIFCRPCEKAQCKFNSLECMALIKPEDILRAVRDILSPNPMPQSPNHEYKRVLIVRTDRIGDVVLSTPVIKALRDGFPCSYIAMMVSPFTRELVSGNPYLDEVIVYDKDKEHKGFFSSFKFALSLRKKRFDLAIILHSTNRVNMVAYIAGIKERIGYSRRLGFLLTKNIPYAKYKGEKHEVDYNLDLLRSIGIIVQDTPLFIPRDAQAEAWAEELFRFYGIDKTKEKIIILHPSASCLSRMWPIERFAEVAGSLMEKYNARVVLVSGLNDIALTEKLAALIKHPVINLGGKTNLMQLAGILRRSTLMISSDSGPVHIAVGCGLPVVVLFGRAQPGLSPLRWGPRGSSDIVLHKNIGCVVCLAHDCKNDFACLKSIQAQDVVGAVDAILKLC